MKKNSKKTEEKEFHRFIVRVPSKLWAEFRTDFEKSMKVSQEHDSLNNHALRAFKLFLAKKKKNEQ